MSRIPKKNHPLHTLLNKIHIKCLMDTPEIKRVFILHIKCKRRKENIHLRVKRIIG